MLARNPMPAPLRPVLTWTFASLLGCGGSLPTPPSTAHPREAYIEVPYPPPAALVEVVPKPRPSGATWVDGHWVWRGRYYAWQRGGWLAAPDGLAYAAWHCRLTDDGRLLFAPGAWYDAAQRSKPPPRTLVNARTPPNEVTIETAAPR
jgi:hypothetical protein